MAAQAPGSAGSDPASASREGGAPVSLLQTLQSLWRDLPGLLTDRLELLTLELQRAGRALAQLVLMLVAVAVLGVTAWLVLWVAIILGLVALGLPLGWALLLLLVVNLAVIAVLLARMRTLLPQLMLPATRRHLTLSPSPEPRPTEPDIRHERPDLAPAGQPAAS